MYPVDYSELIPGAVFSIMEGAKKVGSGVVVYENQWVHDLIAEATTLADWEYLIECVREEAPHMVSAALDGMAEFCRVTGNLDALPVT